MFGISDFIGHIIMTFENLNFFDAFGTVMAIYIAFQDGRLASIHTE